jgi:hypothetical protein
MTPQWIIEGPEYDRFGVRGVYRTLIVRAKNSKNARRVAIRRAEKGIGYKPSYLARRGPFRIVVRRVKLLVPKKRPH